MDPKKYLEMVRRNPVLNQEEFEFLRGRVTMSSYMGLSAQRSVTLNKGRERSESVQLRGASPSIGVISNYQAENGHFILSSENSQPWRWPSLGHDISAKFFGDMDPIGKTIEVEGTPFRVVGVSKAKGSVLGQSQDNFVVIPVETYFKKWGARQE